MFKQQKPTRAKHWLPLRSLSGLGFSETLSSCMGGYRLSKRKVQGYSSKMRRNYRAMSVDLLPLSFCELLDKSSGTWLTCLYIRSLKMSSDILAAHHLLKVSFGPVSDLSVICACPGHLTEPNWLLLSMFWQLNQSPRILPQPSSNDVSSDHCSPQTQSITCWNHPDCYFK